MSDEKLDGGRRWIIETLYRIAQKESVEVDDPPEWEVDGLYWKLAVQVGDRREILKLWRPDDLVAAAVSFFFARSKLPRVLTLVAFPLLNKVATAAVGLDESPTAFPR